jgi:hypothetical protein
LTKQSIQIHSLSLNCYGKNLLPLILKYFYGFYSNIESVQGIFSYIGDCLISVKQLCPHYNIGIKNVNHPFLHCYAFWRLWQRFMNWLGISWCMEKSVNQVVLQWSVLVKGQFQRRALTKSSYGILWNTWSVRNKLIF